jgi:hypothetical protein
MTKAQGRKNDGIFVRVWKAHGQDAAIQRPDVVDNLPAYIRTLVDRRKLAA